MIATRSLGAARAQGKKQGYRAGAGTATAPAPKQRDLLRGGQSPALTLPDQEPPADYPIPKGDNPYSLAKRYEYIHKNLAEAEKYYRAAIAQRIRVESAVKDLAGVLHQQGRTEEACELLESQKLLFVDSQAKFDNLLQSLRTQSRNVSFKYLKLWGLSVTATEDSVKSMFVNPNRIHAVFLEREGPGLCALLQFLSLSAARKTVEGFKFPNKYRLESVNLPMDDSPTGFSYTLFSAETPSTAHTKEDLQDGSEEGVAHYLGSSLYRSINLEGDTGCPAL